MIFMIFDYRETLISDVLWSLMCWWFLLFLTRDTDILSFMKSDVLMILGCRETLMSYEVWSVDDF